MNTTFYSGIAACLCVGMLVGCASRGEVGEVEETAETNQKILRENEFRLHNLENSVTALNTQIAQLNNRVYEVRTRSGQKTSMTVVPVTPSTPKVVSPPPVNSTSVAATQPVASANVATPPVQTPPATVSQSTRSKASPVGRRIDPAAKPSPLPAQAAASQRAATPAPATRKATGSIGQPEQTAGPSGQLAVTGPAAELALPPDDIPVQPSMPEHVNSYTAQATNATMPVQPPANAENVVPVPLIPVSDLSLPPESPQDAPVTAPPATNVPATTQPAHNASNRAPIQGEEAAYKAALNAARAGHTAEGIRLFRDFLQKYPNGRYTANADYWIGECLYAQGKYQDALSQFQNVNNSYPGHHKNADALLKAGITLNRLGDKAGAQEKFRTLLSSFPNSDAARRARAMGAGR